MRRNKYRCRLLFIGDWNVLTLVTFISRTVTRLPYRCKVANYKEWRANFSMFTTSGPLRTNATRPPTLKVTQNNVYSIFCNCTRINKAYGYVGATWASALSQGPHILALRRLLIAGRAETLLNTYYDVRLKIHGHATGYDTTTK